MLVSKSYYPISTVDRGIGTETWFVQESYDNMFKGQLKT